MVHKLFQDRQGKLVQMADTEVAAGALAAGQAAVAAEDVAAEERPERCTDDEFRRTDQLDRYRPA